MTKCKHKGECICGKHPKEESKIVTINGLHYLERTIINEATGDLHFLSLIEDTAIQKPNQVHVNKTEKIKS